MSLYDYQYSLNLAKEDPPFYGLLMAAIRKADTLNLRRFTLLWPEVVNEFARRYNAPGGILPEDGMDEDKSGPCSVCQTETTYFGEYNGDSPVWLCPDHGGKP